jgi:Na+-translocating ferredoxin:NAD+ oxidoreductase RnfC subunit
LPQEQHSIGKRLDVNDRAASSSVVPTFSPLAAGGTLLVPLKAQPDELDAMDARLGAVAAGDRIGQTSSGNAALAPACGEIVGRALVQLLDGSSVPAIRLAVAADAAKASELSPVTSEQANAPLPPHTREDAPQWLTTLANAGIQADRNRSPDLLAQIKRSLDRPVDTVICSILDADPTLPLGAALAANFPREIACGTSILAGIGGAGRAWIVADSRTPQSWLSQLRRILRRQSVRLVLIDNDYPQTDPTLLLYSLLNRRLRPGRLPVEQGVLVLDAAAALAVGRFAFLGERMLGVPLAIRDHLQRQTLFVTSPIGMPLEDILKRLNIPCARAILRGGELLRDLRISRDAVASSSELTVHVCAAEPAINPDPCIRCGWCVEACPTRVHPAALLDAAQREDTIAAERAGVEACIECGICSYVCPSRLPLLGAARLMRERFVETAS